MTKRQYEFFSDLFTNLSHIVMVSFVITNILDKVPVFILIVGGISAFYLYLLGFVFLHEGED